MSSPSITPYDGLSPYRACVTVESGHGTVDGRKVIVPQPKRQAVAICGAAGVRTMPWEDTDVECWAINNFWNSARDSENRVAASRWWEQHQIFPDGDAGRHPGAVIQDENDMRWILDCPVPLYTTEPFKQNPNAVVWDIEYFATKYRDYFTCSFAMMILQAYDEGFEELQIHGLELLLGTKREATVESSCVNYWLGYVEGKGMNVVIAPSPEIRNASGRVSSSDQFILNHPFRYGHEYWHEADFVKVYASRWDSRKLAV